MTNRHIIVFILAVLLSGVLCGCGETIHGMVKDAKRIGSGVKQVFVRE